MVKRMTDIQANMGRMTTQVEDNEDNMKKDDEVSADDVSLSAFGKQMQPTETY